MKGDTQENSQAGSRVSRLKSPSMKDDIYKEYTQLYGPCQALTQVLSPRSNERFFYCSLLLLLSYKISADGSPISGRSVNLSGWASVGTVDPQSRSKRRHS